MHISIAPNEDPVRVSRARGVPRGFRPRGRPAAGHARGADAARRARGRASASSCATSRPAASLLELNPAMPRAPASTMKVLPTWAALDLLGPAYAWKTRALADAPVAKGVLKGNLYLQGGGDPLLTIERWWRFVNDLRQTGLRVIEGDIVVDQTRFTSPGRAARGFRRQVLAHLQRAARRAARQLAVVRFHDPAVRRRQRHRPQHPALPGGPRRREPRDARERPLRRAQQPGVVRDRADEAGSRRRHRTPVRELRPAVAAARDHGPRAIRLRHFRHALAPGGRPVPRRHAARADAAVRTAPADPRVRAAVRDRARHQQVLQQHDGALARARDRRRDERHAGDAGRRRGRRSSAG